MRSVERFNEHGESCIICNTREDKETTLIPIEGTAEGLNYKALQIHVECLDLWIYNHKDCYIIAQKIDKFNNTEKMTNE